MPTHPQNAFCRSDYAIRAKVSSRRRYALAKNPEIYEQHGISKYISFYDISIVKIFRGVEGINKFINSTGSRIYMQKAHPGCETYLKKGGEYLLTGRFVDGSIHLSQCDWSSEWKYMTKQMETGVHGDYDCSCSIATCIDGYCDRNSPCRWEVSWDQHVDECTLQHKACKGNNNLCKWSVHKHYKECNKDLLP